MTLGIENIGIYLIIISLFAAILLVSFKIHRIAKKNYHSVSKLPYDLSRIGYLINNNNNPMVLVTSKYGFGMFVAAEDQSVSEHIRVNGTYQPEMIETLKDFVRSKDTVVHLGVHVGLSDIMLAKIVGNEGKIYSFEPNPELYDIARKNFVINNIDNIITLYPFGASDSECTTNLSFSYDNMGGGAVYKKSSYDKSYNVTLKSIDSVLVDVPHINLLFMDIEGAEIKAIEGASKLLSRSKDAIIIMEWTPDMLSSIGSNAEEFIKSFITNGRKFFKITTKNATNRYVEISREELLAEAQCDIVILPKDFEMSKNLSNRFSYLNK